MPILLGVLGERLPAGTRIPDIPERADFADHFFHAGDRLPFRSSDSRAATAADCRRPQARGSREQRRRNPPTECVAQRAATTATSMCWPRWRSCSPRKRACNKCSRPCSTNSNTAWAWSAGPSCCSPRTAASCSSRWPPMSPREQHEGLRYRRGEGILGPSSRRASRRSSRGYSQEPRFTNRIYRRQQGETTTSAFFACRSRWGARSWERSPSTLPLQEPVQLAERCRLLGIVASMIAFDVKSGGSRPFNAEVGGGEPPPSRRARGAVPPGEHHRQLAPHARGLPADPPGGHDRHDRAHPRRIGHRQGTGRLGHPLQQPAGREALREGELRRPAARGCWRASSSATRRGRFTGALHARIGPHRGGRGRHAVPRRDRRLLPGHPGQAAARAPGAGVRAGGRATGR